MMIGTMVNVTTIVTGSLIGTALRKGIGERYKASLMNAMGLVAVCLGVNSAVHALPDSQYPVLFIVSLALGSVIGTGLDIDARFNRLIGRISGGSDLAKGLSTAVLLYCVGAMSILGPMQSALQGDNTYLFTNAMLDGITSIVLASSFGLGIALAAVAIFCWQGSIYMLARLIEPFITDTLLTELTIVGGVLILSSGLSVLKIKDLKTLNLLPALLVPPLAVPLLGMLGF